MNYAIKTLPRRLEVKRDLPRILKPYDAVQQQSLISNINLLTNCGTPPTNAMVHYFIKEITGINVGNNYITQFWYKYSDILAAGYLKPINLLKKKS